MAGTVTARRRLMQRQRLRTPILIVLAFAAVVAILFALRGLDQREPPNVRGEPEPGFDTSPDASPAPPEGAEGAAGIVTQPDQQGEPR